MKALILLFSFVSVICLISCGKTDSEPTTTPTGTTPTPTPTANTATTPTGITPTATTPEKQKYQSPSGQGRHPPLVVCNIQNYKNFIRKPGIHNCNLREAKLREVDLEGANLQRADLRGAYLAGTNFYQADLRGVDLRGAILYHFLENPHFPLIGAVRRLEAILVGANLTGAKVTRKQAEYLTAQGLSGFVVVE